MNTKIFKNYIYNTLYQILSLIAPIITTPYIARILHSEGVGLFSYTNTITTVFSLFAALGFSGYGQREIAYHQEDPHARSVIFYEIFIFRGLLTIFASVAFIIFSVYYSNYKIYLLPQVGIILSVIFEMSWYFQGIENFKIIVTRNAIVKILTIAAIFLFVKKESDIVIYIVINTLSPLISNVVYCAAIRKNTTKISIAELHPFRHFKGAIEFFLPLIAVKIYSYFDNLMLGYYMDTTSENGYYEQARKITAIIVTIIVSLNAVMMSRISNLYVKNAKEKIRTYYSKTLSIIMMMLFPVCIGLILISDNFVSWFLGSDFQPVSPLLKLCSLLIPLMCIGNFVGVQFLSPTGLQNQMTLAYVVASIVNVIMNILLIPRFCSKGALIASIFAEAVSCFIQIFLLINSEYRFSFPKGIWKYCMSACVMGVTLIMLHNLMQITGIKSTILDIFVGIIIYCASLAVLQDSLFQEIIHIIYPKTRKRE